MKRGLLLRMLVLPACAGMILKEIESYAMETGAPHMRGDDPGSLQRYIEMKREAGRPDEAAFAAVEKNYGVRIEHVA